MADVDSSGHKFFNRVWSYYQLHDFSLPCHGSSATLFSFIRCFENFSPHFTIRITPYGFEHLLCATLLIEIKPGARETLAKATANKRKATAKQTPATHRTKKRSSEKRPTSSSRGGRKGKEHEEEETEVESYNDEDILDLPRINKAISLKICLDPCMDLLFSSRPLPQWLHVCLGRCLGVAGRMELVSFVRGDPRHIIQLVSQRGGSMDNETSSQAVMEHEWVAALQKRGRFHGCPAPLGPVTKMLGAMPNNFPTVQNISVTYKKVPLSVLPRPVANIDEAELEECHQNLARLKVSSIKVNLSSPSLLHLYYNASREVYQAKENLTHMLKSYSNVGVVSVGGDGRDEDVTTIPPTVVPDDSDDDGEDEPMELDADAGDVAAAVAATSTRSKKKKKNKFNLEGVVTDVPFFIQRLRAKATFRPVLEYK